MELLVLAARCILIGVFLVSGIAKLLDRTGSQASLSAFGVADRFISPLSLGLPILELVLVGLLVVDRTATLGALGAAAVLGLFTVVIGLTLYHGRRPACHCFGRLSTAPISWRTLVRNLLFTAAALLVLGAGPGALQAQVSRLATTAGIGEAVVLMVLGALVLTVAAQSWFIGHVLKQQGRLLMRLERVEQRVALEAPPLPGSPHSPAVSAGLPPGAPAPTFQLSSVDGTPQLLPPIAFQPRPTLVLFVDPDCGPCHALLPDVERWRQEYRACCAIVVISRGTAEVNRAKFQHHPHGSFLLQWDREVAVAYQVEVTPSAVLVRSDGTIGSTVHAGAEAIRRLVEHEVQEWTKPVLTH
jgi:thiol-disulfide isomerase/thioredoxin/uncharacterized membrane protein YphA (DoxX/SURF4 family)